MKVLVTEPASLDYHSYVYEGTVLAETETCYKVRQLGSIWGWDWVRKSACEVITEHHD